MLTFYLSSSFLKLNHIIDIYKSTKIVLTRRINVGYLIIGTCQSWKQLRIYQCLIFNFMSVNKSYYLKDKWIYHKPQMLHGIVDPWPLEITNSSSCSIVRMVSCSSLVRGLVALMTWQIVVCIYMYNPVYRTSFSPSFSSSCIMYSLVNLPHPYFL